GLQTLEALCRRRRSQAEARWHSSLSQLKTRTSRDSSPRPHWRPSSCPPPSHASTPYSWQGLKRAHGATRQQPHPLVGAILPPTCAVAACSENLAPLVSPARQSLAGKRSHGAESSRSVRVPQPRDPPQSGRATPETRSVLRASRY